MWTASSAALRGDVVDFAAELFCDSHNKTARVRRQVLERTKQHALIGHQDGRSDVFAFDHVEFYHFFLGYSVGRMLIVANTADVLQMLRRGTLPNLATDVAAAQMSRDTDTLRGIVENLCRLCQVESTGSFVRENAGGIVIRALERAELLGVGVRHLTFPVESLRRAVPETSFRSCYFQPTAVGRGCAKSDRFEVCEFEAIELSEGDVLDDVEFVDCKIRAVTAAGSDDPVFDPAQIVAVLRRAGAVVTSSIASVATEEVVQPDEALVVTGRILRAFARSTELNEGTIRERLGIQHNFFMDRVMPELEEAGIVKRVPYHGRGVQRRYRLQAALRSVNDGLESCRGEFETFLTLVRTARTAE